MAVVITDQARTRAGLPPSATMGGAMANSEETAGGRDASRTDRPEPTTPQLAAAASTFGLLSNPARLHVVWLASRGVHDVTALAERAGVGAATMSQHLSKLRLAGVISVRRDGRRHIYTVEDPHVLAMVEQIFEHIAPDGSLAPDPPQT
jgi:DNA-binding transcriptional ArsR family regulator